jgi:predicted TIM-barrel fold metal-dependent hydrolase
MERERRQWRHWRPCLASRRKPLLYGRTGDKPADHPDNDELYALAERLAVPLHFHPQTPVQPVIDAYYSNLPEPMGPVLAGAGLGWYYDLGVQYLRMIFSGVFDRFPDLQVIAGHWGEGHRNWERLTARAKRPTA